MVLFAASHVCIFSAMFAEQNNLHFLNDFSIVDNLLGKGGSGNVVEGAVVVMAVSCNVSIVPRNNGMVCDSCETQRGFWGGSLYTQSLNSYLNHVA